MPGSPSIMRVVSSRSALKMAIPDQLLPSRNGTNDRQQALISELEVPAPVLPNHRLDPLHRIVGSVLQKNR